MWNANDFALTMLYLGVATDELQSKQIRGQYFHPQVHPVVTEYALDEDLQQRILEFLRRIGSRLSVALTASSISDGSISTLLR
jgi:hypothetical protein